MSIEVSHVLYIGFKSNAQDGVAHVLTDLVSALPLTAVVAAANPCGGHYNRAKTVNENLKISGALLSRFDLIFILLDRPNEARDQVLSEHVIALHSGGVKAVRFLANTWIFLKFDDNFISSVPISLNLACLCC